MEYIIKDEKLELKYQKGKGAWTYHLRIPNSKNIEGKWGDIKVSGFIDSFKIEARNLAPINGEDKMLSINGEIRKAINKKEGDIVNVTLYLLSNKEKITKMQILETFKESNVLEVFNKLNEIEKNDILDSIMLQKNEEKQIKLIINHIDKLRTCLNFRNYVNS
ncbi:DUF1905 domain-containing protein [Arcicella sp. LKC2W]|uniref:DUF1905 domain-containing protein n=1 Tax=Arcicella sp. LKC2W TaxID=2984198 RepID=UPI002B1F0345|nr:DUF1905 domain-containing protein [Arcicella sp. LKC2W]MEA5461491.1 DUF1905 domain-containing protein [Arcicella sp. LKC2W]